MPEIKKETEQVVPMVDKANQDIVDFAKTEEAEADRIFYESQGFQADGKTPLEDPPAAAEEPAKKEETEPKKTEPEKVGLPNEAEAKPNEDADLTKDLTVTNAEKRISAAQKRMHDSNTRANTSEGEVSRLQEENQKLRAEAEQKASTAPATDPIHTETPAAEAQTPDEVATDLENLRKEYPEIAEPMIKLMQKQEAQNKILQDRIDKQDEREKLREKNDKETTENAHYKAISDVHPDFTDISQEPLLDDWIEGLPAMERAGAQAIRTNGKTSDVIDMLTKFKEANGYKLPGKSEEAMTKTPNTKIEKAKSMSTPQFNKAKEVNTQENQVLFTQEQIAKWTEKEWAENEKAVDEALSKGLVR